MKRKQLYGIGILTSILTSNMIKKKRLSDNDYKISDELVRNVIKNVYIEDIDSNTLNKYAIEGMVSNLDPDCEYIPQDEIEEFNKQFNLGDISGIGGVLAVFKNSIMITNIVNGGPSDGKLKKYDIILEVDGKSIYNDLKDTKKKIKGQIGTEVVLKVSRSGKVLPPIKIIRDIIKIGKVKKNKYNGKLYINLEEDIPNLFNNVNDILQKEKKNIKGLIIDLRDIIGKSFNEIVKISELFLKKKKKIVKTVIRNKGREFNTIKDGEFTNIPIIILINNGTGGTPEILTAALKDNYRAIIIGTETFGKGNIQDILNVGDKYLSKYLSINLGVIKLTTKRYIRPNGERIDFRIKPDIEIFDEEILIDSSLKLFPIMEKYGNDIENNLEKIIKDFKNDL